MPTSSLAHYQKFLNKKPGGNMNATPAGPSQKRGADDEIDPELNKRIRSSQDKVGLLSARISELEKDTKNLANRGAGIKKEVADVEGRVQANQAEIDEATLAKSKAQDNINALQIKLAELHTHVGSLDERLRRGNEWANVHVKRMEEMKSRGTAVEKDEEEKTKMLRELKAEREGQLM